VDFRPFEVEVFGEGPPMILLPGLSCPGEVWDTTVAHYEDSYECHVVSIAGFGGTPGSFSGPFLEPVMDGLVDYLAAHQLEDPVIVGHSLGGFLALQLGAEHPEIPRALMIVDSLPFLFGVTNPGATEAQAQQAALGMRGYFESIDDATYEAQIRSGVSSRPMVLKDEDHEKIVEWGLASDRATVTNAMTELYSTDLRDDLGAIQCPTLVLGAWRGYEAFTDKERTEDRLKSQYAELEGVKIVVGDKARHFIMWDDAEWMFAEMDSFLVGVSE
jgi:pimeloyl-ACP methyl ester carboxylesterase